MKSVDTKSNPGLAKLPTEVRNKMGYMKHGGMASESKKMMSGGMAMKHGGKAHSDMAKDKPMMKKVAASEVKGHEKRMHGMAKGGVAKMVTKEMEYDYKTGKKSFPGSTAKKDAHAEKEGKRVAKDLAYDKAKKMAKGGGIEIKGKTKGTMIKMRKGGSC
jgi:hypothetical protein